MACTRFEYVKKYEQQSSVLKNCWFVLRVDGRNFSDFCLRHDFEKPNDIRALKLMNRSALGVMEQFGDIVVAYGQSDEYSFVFRRKTNIWNRNESKILSNVVSLFTSTYVLNWPKYFPDVPLQYAVSFDGRIVSYPTDRDVRDYLSWRQADCHINNQYNTCFWNLAQKSSLSKEGAYERLKGTSSAQKNELLFSLFGINYNNIDEIYRKGTVILRSDCCEESFARLNLGENCKGFVIVHLDIISDKFWTTSSTLFDS